jgi:uncharacterized protein YbcC (UPF0753/DUF2309 family)
MQYFASSVDPQLFGSGSKTIHNVVGKFGLFSGEGGDLMTGLPWESLHNGQSFQHHPLRLLSVIQAPRAAIDRVLHKHAFLVQLISNGWVQLTCLEVDKLYSCTGFGDWTEIPPAVWPRSGSAARAAGAATDHYHLSQPVSS